MNDELFARGKSQCTSNNEARLSDDAKPIIILVVNDNLVKKNCSTTITVTRELTNIFVHFVKSNQKKTHLSEWLGIEVKEAA